MNLEPSLKSYEDEFKLDGEQIRIFSGAIHYFRIPQEYWRNRLQSARDAGLNCIETYVPWNLHEKTPNNFDFENELDIVKFIKIAGELKLKVICRPGPYICSEWEWGGLPYWLLRDPQMRVRVNYHPYQDAVKRYFDFLLPKLAPLQWSKNGPIIAFQVENEYGDYVDQDHDHLPWLQDMMKSHLSELLFISDGGHTIRKTNMYNKAAKTSKWAKDLLLDYHMPDDLLKTTNFKYLNVANGIADNLTSLSQLQPNRPMMVMEFWAGWFDYWAHPRNPLNNQYFEKTLRDIVRRGASLNFYMFHGGTNFGFMNGALTAETGYYTADVTSYDYDCPINEHGIKNDKWYIIKKVIQEYRKSTVLASNDEVISSRDYGQITAKSAVSLWDGDCKSIFQNFELENPLPMEQLPTADNFGQGYGYVLYSREIKIENSKIQLSNLRKSIKGRSRFYMTDGKNRKLHHFNGLQNKSDGDEDTIEFNVENYINLTLEILIENPGRINFQTLNGENKGMLMSPNLSGAKFTSAKWSVTSLPCSPEEINQLEYAWDVNTLSIQLPAFFSSNLVLADKPTDTFIHMRNWGKGFVYVNGKNLGRYWMTAGPQKTLYLPGPWLKKGYNKIVWFEEEIIGDNIEFLNTPELGERSAGDDIQVPSTFGEKSLTRKSMYADSFTM